MNIDDEEPPLLVNADELADLDSHEHPGHSIKVPITIVTGRFGGRGDRQHGKKIAVILNEFGDSIDIEKSLTVNKGGERVEEWLEVGNGCICCSVRDSGVAAIESLMEKKGAFDYILLETTGLAEPGNLAPLFWVDEGLGSTIYLDGIVTLVDAKNVLKSLDGPVQETTKTEEHDGHQGPAVTTAHLQISHADVIVINKSDLVSELELLSVKERVQAINGLAKIHVTSQGQVPQLEGFLLDLNAYSDVGALDVADKGHSHLDPTVATITIAVPILEVDQLPKLDEWLRSILWDSKLPFPGSRHETFEIHRLKARLPISNGEVKIVQGVRDVFEIVDAASTSATASENAPILQGKIVLIGKNLIGKPFRQSLLDTIDSF
ncbi:hypothetical protein QTJ16_004572 [Diplocarpon rosae]|uniref:CobW/HypB/UreG nucleotide-binding domain-containing protein n=1 Tax=Diplocarpon rosae TaxID=946125 RepID=A0AAD9WCI2_9HELO|nr:hypothetical protein QTJ16_004572 [Diplocarpon rosae]